MTLDLAREARFALGAMEVRPSTREVVFDGRGEVLEPRIMQVLVVLARRRGEVVSRDELIDLCWDGRSVGDDAIARCVAAIRRLAEAHGGFSVETVARVGYRLSEGAGEPGGQTMLPLPAKALPPIWRGRWTVVGVLAALLLAAGGLWVVRDRLHRAEQPSDIRVAVLPFEAVTQDPVARQFADTLLDKIVSALSAEQVVTISRTDSAALRGRQASAQAAKLGAGLMLDGVVENDGKSLEVQVHLEDPRAHVTLWSKAFEGPVTGGEGLGNRIAARATDVTKWAVSPKLKGVWLDRSVVAAYLDGTDDFTHEGGGRAVEIARDVVAKAPGFAAGHDLLAQALIGYTSPAASAPDAGAAGAAEAVAESAKESRIALSLDPKDGLAYADLANDMPLSAWREREQLFLKGLAVDPNNPALADAYAWFLLENVGRMREAAEWGQRFVRAEPFMVSAIDGVAIELSAAGRGDEATAMIANSRRLWPDDWEVPVTEFFVALSTQRYARALALLDDPAVRKILAPTGQGASIETWRTAVQAWASADPARMRAAARAVSAAADGGAINHRQAVWMLSSLGDVDDAFREADRAFTHENLSRASNLRFGETGGVSALFGVGTAAMRRDPRFMPLAARLGLVDYWRSSGHWPDFCAESGLPYDCRVEAAKLAAAGADSVGGGGGADREPVRRDPL